MNRPVDEHLCLLPSRVHRLALQDDDHDKVAVFFKAGGETSARCFRDAGFDTCKPGDA